jgi:hypothetical protein
MKLLRKTAVLLEVAGFRFLGLTAAKSGGAACLNNSSAL